VEAMLSDGSSPALASYLPQSWRGSVQHRELLQASPTWKPLLHGHPWSVRSSAQGAPKAAERDNKIRCYLAP
jgi:hypothetical protein